MDEEMMEEAIDNASLFKFGWSLVGAILLGMVLDSVVSMPAPAMGWLWPLLAGLSYCGYLMLNYQKALTEEKQAQVQQATAYASKATAYAKQMQAEAIALNEKATELQAQVQQVQALKDDVAFERKRTKGLQQALSQAKQSLSELTQLLEDEKANAQKAVAIAEANAKANARKEATALAPYAELGKLSLQYSKLRGVINNNSLDEQEREGAKADCKKVKAKMDELKDKLS